MNRYLLSLFSLLGVLFWLLFSYAPSTIFALPQLAMHGLWPGLLLQSAAILGLIVFLSIQCWILWATYRMRKVVQTNAAASGQRLRIVAEFFWTALPIVMTIGLAALSLPIWRGLRP